MKLASIFNRMIKEMIIHYPEMDVHYLGNGHFKVKMLEKEYEVYSPIQTKGSDTDWEGTFLVKKDGKILSKNDDDYKKIDNQFHQIYVKDLKWHDDHLEDLIKSAIEKTDTSSMTTDNAIEEIAKKVMKMKSVDKDVIVDMIRSALKKDVMEDESDSNWPKIIASAGQFHVELEEDEQIILYKGHNKIVKMPLILWQQLTRT